MICCIIIGRQPPAEGEMIKTTTFATTDNKMMLNAKTLKGSHQMKVRHY
jgi:hypothetical protein